MRLNCNSGKKRNDGFRHAVRWIILGVLLLALILLLLERNLESVILDMASARAEAMAVEYIHEAVRDVMEEAVTYEDMMTVQTDAHGRVTMLQANAVRMNELATVTALEAQSKLESAESQSIAIPLGAALGVPFLSGINQTRHKIYLSLRTTVRLVIPSGARQVSLGSQVLIAESIIVGEVPQSYVQVPEMSDALNFAVP